MPDQQIFLSGACLEGHGLSLAFYELFSIGENETVILTPVKVERHTTPKWKQRLPESNVT
jgi:hypothetical protein